MWVDPRSLVAANTAAAGAATSRAEKLGYAGAVDLSGARPSGGAAGALRRPPRGWWGTLVFPAAVLAVHQLRYLLAFGSDAGSELGAQGDRYVATAAVVAGALVFVSLSVGLMRLVTASRGRGSLMAARAPLWMLWLGLTLLLFVGFCALEGLEIALEPHHAAGLTGVFGHGGFWSLPAAALVAAVMALLVHGGRALLVIAARHRCGRVTRSSGSWPARAPAGAPPCGPMASCAAGRAPPVHALA
jgi:hypothetical protein